MRGVKQILKPDAYKQWEPRLQIIRECRCITSMYCRTSSVRRNVSTRGHNWRLVYYEAYLHRQAAVRREKFLKNNGHAKRAVMQRVKAMLLDAGEVE